MTFQTGVTLLSTMRMTGKNEYGGDENKSTMIDESDRPVLALDSIQ